MEEVKVKNPKMWHNGGIAIGVRVSSLKERKVQPKEVIPMKPGIRFTCNNSEIKITKNA